MASVQYNGTPTLTLRERIQAFLGKKDAPLPVGVNVFSTLPAAQWNAVSPSSYFGEGYRLNSAVFACTRALALGFSEPPLICYSDETKKKPLPGHPLRQLIKRPNEWMGEDEFWRSWIVYSVSSGNAYGYIVPTRSGVPGEVWPYSDIVMAPVPSQKKWIDHYDYSVDNGLHKVSIPVEQVIHYKYAPDPFFPHKGMGALRPVAREVDTDNELTRYLKSLLQNDAVPRTVITVPPGVAVTPKAKSEMKEAFKKLFGGDNRGDVGVFEMGAEPKRLSLNMDELAFDALRGVPEARIASAYGVPAIVAGLNIGLARSTYSNYEEARKAFTEQTLMPLWKSVASEVQQSLVPLMGNDCYVDFDYSQVRALQDNADTRMVWVVSMGQAGYLSVNEVRAEAGKDSVQGGDEIPALAPKPEPVPAQLPAGASDGSQDGSEEDNGSKGRRSYEEVRKEMLSNPDTFAAYVQALEELKAKAATPTVDTLEARIEKGMGARLEDLYGKLAGAVEASE